MLDLMTATFKGVWFEGDASRRAGGTPMDFSLSDYMTGTLATVNLVELLHPDGLRSERSGVRRGGAASASGGGGRASAASELIAAEPHRTNMVATQMVI